MFQNHIPSRAILRFLIASLFALGAAGLALHSARAGTVSTTWTVNTLEDGSDGACTTARCTLTDAVAAAQSGDTIIFDASLSGTLNLSATLKPRNNVTIHGSPRVTIDGGGTKLLFWLQNCTTINLDDLTLVDGHSDTGGALYIESGCTVNLARSTLSRNSADAGGAIDNAGTLNLTDSTLQGNQANIGGGIASSSGNLKITRSTLNGNSATSRGGGIYAYDSTDSVTDSTFDSNSADEGGGILTEYGTLTVTGSTFIKNRAPTNPGIGGGIYSYSNLNISNSTFTGNSAYWAGGIANNYTMNLTNSTLSGNSATDIADPDIASSVMNFGTMNFANNIIANSTSGKDCYSQGPIGTNLDNLVLVDSLEHPCSADFDTDPNLASLADNGGPTWTMALQAGSFAIDKGDNTTCNASPVNKLDQRGVPRPQGLSCDIGAYEYGATTPDAFSKVSPVDATLIVSPDPKLSWNTSANAAFYEYCYAPTSGCTNWTSVGTDTSVTLSGLLFDQVYYWQVRAVATGGPMSADSGAYWSFTTAGAPSATTSAATGLISNNATLNGTVNAHHADATVAFDYGPTTSYGSFVTADPSPVSGASDTAVSKALTGLDFNTLYHFRLEASNSWGTTYGDDMTFSTPCLPGVSVSDLGDSGANTLRQAIHDVCTGDTITFDGSLAGKTILLTSSTLEIPRSMTIDGSSLNPPVTISGGDNLGIFTIDSHVTVTLDGLVLAHGYAAYGGAIYADYYSTLTVRNSTLENNAATHQGGAILNKGDVTVTDSTFDSNHAPTGGGAIEQWGDSLTVMGSTFTGNDAGDACGGAIDDDGHVDVTNSTFTGNTAACGGAIVNWDNLSVTNSTFSGNSATTPTDEYEGGAGIYNDWKMNLVNTIIANSTSGGDCINDDSDGATIDTNTDNLVEDDSCSTGGINFKTGDPLLAHLANNGGPTQTMALLPGSPAIDAGDETACADAATVNHLDQRGVARPTGKCDIGAFESQGFTLGSLTGTPQSTTVNTGFTTPLGLTVSPVHTGDPVEGGVVTFAAPISGASASITGSPATIAANGTVSVTATANGTVGSFQVMASASGASNVNFNLTNTLAVNTFSKVSPQSGTSGWGASVTLSWNPNPSGGTYYYCYDTTNDNNCYNWSNAGSNTSVNLVGLPPNTTFYWQVKAISGNTTVYADGSKTAFWSFKTASYPGNFNKVAPAKGATGQPLNLTLSWGASSGAPTYWYCYDTASGCTSWVNNGTATSVALSGLLPNTTYYWQVKAVNASGTTYANIFPSTYWSFTTGSLPGAFVKSSPASGITGVPSSVTIKWGSSSGATSYWYCYDTTNDNACSNWVSNGTSTSKTLSGLAPNTAYYWQVKALNKIGSTFANGSATAFWSFTTGGLPGAFGKITPANNATSQPSNPTLTWGAASGATEYWYCLSKTKTCSTWVKVGTATSKALSGLSSKTTYYWQVKALNSFGSVYADGAAGALWSFKTK